MNYSLTSFYKANRLILEVTKIVVVAAVVKKFRSDCALTWAGILTP